MEEEVLVGLETIEFDDGWICRVWYEEEIVWVSPLCDSKEASIEAWHNKRKETAKLREQEATLRKLLSW